MDSVDQFQIVSQTYKITIQLQTQIIKILVQPSPESYEYPFLFQTEFTSFELQVNQQQRQIFAQEFYDYFKSNPSKLTFQLERLKGIYSNQQNFELYLEKIFWDKSPQSSNSFIIEQNTIALQKYHFNCQRIYSQKSIPKEGKTEIKFQNFVHLSACGIGVGIISKEAISRKMRCTVEQPECIGYWYEPACWERQGRVWNSSVHNEAKNQFGYFSLEITDITLNVEIDIERRSVRWNNGHQQHISKIGDHLSSSQLFLFVEMKNNGDWVSYELIKWGRSSI